MKKFIKVFVWLSIGLLMAYVAGASFASGELNIQCFYDAGEADDLQPDILQLSEQGFEYASPEDELFTVTSDVARKYLGVTFEKWNYIIFDIKVAKSETIDLTLTAFNKNWETLGNQNIQLKNGKNCVSYELPPCNFIFLEMNGQMGKQVMFRQIQFREKLFAANVKAGMWGALGVFGAYILISIYCLILLKKRKPVIVYKVKNFVKGIYSQYMKIQYRSSVLLYEILGKRKIPFRRSLRIVSLGSWIFIEIIMRGYGLRSELIWFHYLMAIIVLFIFAVTLLEAYPKPVKWDTTLFYAWFILGIVMIVSSLMVEKKWPWVGILFLTMYGLFYFVWGNVKRPHEVLREICYSLKIVFWITTIISVFAREYVVNQPYSGIYKNQNVFTSFLIMMLAINLTQIINIFGRKRYVFYKNLLLCIENCIILFFIYRTESRGGLLTGMILMLLFLVHFFRVSIRRKNWRWILCIQMIILIFPVFYVCELTYIKVQSISPFSITYEVAQKEEDVYAGDFKVENKDIVYAGEGTHLVESLGAKTFGAFTSGRTVIWKRYIRDFNLFGHYNKEYIGGLSMHSHNAFLYMIYLYGILSIIPYCVMWIMLFYQATIFQKRRFSYSFLPKILLAGFFVQAMTDTLEEPFSMESWIIAYIVMGILFIRNTKRNERTTKDLISCKIDLKKK